MNFLERLMNGGWNPDVPRTGVRPNFGLEGAQIQPQARSPYERTLQPGEQRSRESLRDMLAEVILAAGSFGVPATTRGAARVSPANRPPPSKASVGQVANFSRFIPRVLGIQDPVKMEQIARKAAELELTQTWRTQPVQAEADFASLLRQAQTLLKD